jgi:hypothetical protein
MTSGLLMRSSFVFILRKFSSLFSTLSGGPRGSSLEPLLIFLLATSFLKLIIPNAFYFLTIFTVGEQCNKRVELLLSKLATGLLNQQLKWRIEMNYYVWTDALTSPANTTRIIWGIFIICALRFIFGAEWSWKYWISRICKSYEKWIRNFGRKISRYHLEI